MCREVTQAFESGEHVLVQAGTGTGKSLGYLAPALSHVLNSPGSRVVVATATLALQTQLATKDVPVVIDAVEAITGRRPTAALLKGRSNYACLHRVRDGVVEDQQPGLIAGGELVTALRAADAAPDSVLGAEVLALREWAEGQAESGGLADRDDAPSHTPAGWAQVSVPVRECLGATSCPYGMECFVEQSRDRAREADLVVTNHALLAIDALHGGTALPEHDLLVVDEAHELVARVTGAASQELSGQQVERVARRALPWLTDGVAADLLEAGEALRTALELADPGRVTDQGSTAAMALAQVRQVARAALSDFKATATKALDAPRIQAQAAVQEVYDVAERMAALDEHDVVWVAERERAGRWVVVAPLNVSGLVRESILPDVTAVFTSATLTIGGGFDPVARQLGLTASSRSEGRPAPTWHGVDVGSPFEYSRQGILYVATRLPPPSREGLGEAALSEIVELVRAAGGRTLGLFASHRNATAAASHVRTALPDLTVLCQGDAQLPELTRRFIEEPETSLFGTLSLWQGVDVPGETCQLVLIDKIPFPRPDEPLVVARQDAVTASGGNGFMQVAATHAGLLLAQGSGRLVRRLSDRGVVAILDPRLMTARYGSFLRASIPPFWTTTDADLALGALRRLRENGTPVASGAGAAASGE
ncbi:MAG: ATP-dependent DNA helicase [Actinobacteria bacterium]|nr:ATP-dependent DNA helicase [Actinomycetota bacterium]